MIEFKTGNIFESDCEAITNTVNCVGIMGGGLAKAFKKNYPEMFREYSDVCCKCELWPGVMHIWENPNGTPKYIVNFPTKDDWRNPSDIGFIIDGLVALKDEIIKRDIKSIAIPSLGCGLGGLSYVDVKKEIEKFAVTLPNIKIIVYEPLS
jgi:O-acetyl-ADP-ribose deacetylase (regulator of RNase III)